MAHGAPDHTRLQDDHHTHYKIYEEFFSDAAVGTIPVWTNIINKDMVGVFGWVWWKSNDPYLYCRIKVDGTVVLFFRPIDFHTMGPFGVGSAWGRMGCIKYDDAITYYSAFYDPGWTIYVHNNLTVEVAYAIAHVGWGSCRVRWKELP